MHIQEIILVSETELLRELNRETHLKVLSPRMLSGHLQGRFLSMISHMLQPEFILEIGTYTGYSAICLSEGLSENW
jgi:caffeoyl-CoA O-methyltransferase